MSLRKKDVAGEKTRSQATLAEMKWTVTFSAQNSTGVIRVPFFHSLPSSLVSLSQKKITVLELEETGGKVKENHRTKKRGEGEQQRKVRSMNAPGRKDKLEYRECVEISLPPSDTLSFAYTLELYSLLYTFLDL